MAALHAGETPPGSETALAIHAQGLTKHFGDVILQLPKPDLTVDRDSLGLEIIESDNSVEISTADVDATIQTLIRNKVSLAHLQIRARTLEDLFLELTGKELRP